MRHFIILAAVAVLLALGAAAYRFRPAPLPHPTPPPRPVMTDKGKATRIEAARDFARQYAQSVFGPWKIEATAEGPRCNVLVIRTSVIMEDSMVEALHYGSGPYEVYADGVQRFFRQAGFRGVVYHDSSERIWTYGAVTQSEAGELEPCR